MKEAKVGDFMCIHGASKNSSHPIVSALIGTVQQIQNIVNGYHEIQYRALDGDYSWFSRKDFYLIPFEDMPYLEVTKIEEVKEEKDPLSELILRYTEDW